MRSLPVLLAQSPPLPPNDAVALLRRDVFGLAAEFTQSRLMVFPEFHTCRADGSPDQRHRLYEEMAEPLDGARVHALAAIARDAGVWLVPGTVVERGPGGELFNTAIVFNPAGELVASYRKLFPWRPTEPFDPGTSFVTFDIPEVGRVGLAICYDLWFPEVARQLAWLGAETVVVPTQTTTSDRQQEVVLAQASAIQNQVHVLSVNAAGPLGTGRSLVVDPEGVVRAQATGAGPTALTDVVDFDAVTRVRTYGTCGLNRMWSQMRQDDPVLELPMYAGRLDPARWNPSPPFTERSAQ